MRDVETRGYGGVTTWAGPSKTARGRQEKQAGRREGTWHGQDRDTKCRGLDHLGRKVTGKGSSGEGGLSRGRGGSVAGGESAGDAIEGETSRGWRQRQRQSSQRKGTDVEHVCQEGTSDTRGQQQGGHEHRGGNRGRTE